MKVMFHMLKVVVLSLSLVPGGAHAGFFDFLSSHSSAEKSEPAEHGVSVGGEINLAEEVRKPVFVAFTKSEKQTAAVRAFLASRGFVLADKAEEANTVIFLSGDVIRKEDGKADMGDWIEGVPKFTKAFAPKESTVWRDGGITHYTSKLTGGVFSGSALTAIIGITADESGLTKSFYTAYRDFGVVDGVDMLIYVKSKEPEREQRATIKVTGGESLQAMVDTAINRASAMLTK